RVFDLDAGVFGEGVERRIQVVCFDAGDTTRDTDGLGSFATTAVSGVGFSASDERETQNCGDREGCEQSATPWHNHEYLLDSRGRCFCAGVDYDRLMPIYSSEIALT